MLSLGPLRNGPLIYGFFMISAIVLAGGASVRMGTPKALLRFRGTTFLEAILDAAFAVGLSPRVVVLGHDADKVLQGIDLSDVVVAVSDELDAGPVGSIRAGVDAVLNHAVDAAIIWHVDQPHVRLETVRALVDTFRLERPAITLPTYSGQRGHPILLARSIFEELWGVQADQDGARAVVHADPSRVREVAVTDPAVLEDIDTPAAYQRLLKSVDSVRE